VHGPHGGGWHSSSRVHDIGLSVFGEFAGSSWHALRRTMTPISRTRSE
jgi:hypothetical protein